jgi:ubiquinone/menaquinone biosynthesis C-methylase UbiE
VSIIDRYAGAAARWADGASLVYAPIARELVACRRHSLAGRTVLDVGAGTGVASAALTDQGARCVAVDLSHEMLAWNAVRRPPAAVADVRRLPIRDRAVDDFVAAFVFNHLLDPAAAFAEAARVTRPAGTLLGCVYGINNRSPVRDALDEAARQAGWQTPRWYSDMKEHAVPLLGTADDMRRVANDAGLVDVIVDERAVDVGVTTAEELVDYRLGQAHFSDWLGGLTPDQVEQTRTRLVQAIEPIMTPFRPVVVFLSAYFPV